MFVTDTLADVIVVEVRCMTVEYATDFVVVIPC
jgi:hypothetical protein